MFLFDVCKEGGIAEISFATGTLIISRFDGDAQLILKWILFIHNVFWEINNL